jgi:hypothetical protein
VLGLAGYLLVLAYDQRRGVPTWPRRQLLLILGTTALYLHHRATCVNMCGQLFGGFLRLWVWRYSMFSRLAASALVVAVTVGSLSAQGQKPSGTKSVMHDLTVTTSESVYTGTMDLTVDAGKVTGKMVITSPSAITGTVAGTSKAGVMNLEFPYHMTERNCDGTVKMTITLPEKLGPSKGTMETAGCGDSGEKVTGTVELKVAAAKPATK